MSNYRRLYVKGGIYFFTQVTDNRLAWLCTNIGRKALREAMINVSKKHPFSILAFVLLPDHFHCIFSLPSNDHDFSVRMRLIKSYVTKNYKQELLANFNKKENKLWQKRFWEHLIRDEEDLENHCNYIHYNPVKHGLCVNPQDWEFSTIHRFIAEEIYPEDWGKNEKIIIPDDIDNE